MTSVTYRTCPTWEEIKGYYAPEAFVALLEAELGDEHVRYLTKLLMVHAQGATRLLDKNLSDESHRNELAEDFLKRFRENRSLEALAQTRVFKAITEEDPHCNEEDKLTPNGIKFMKEVSLECALEAIRKENINELAKKTLCQIMCAKTPRQTIQYNVSQFEKLGCNALVYREVTDPDLFISAGIGADKPINKNIFLKGWYTLYKSGDLKLSDVEDLYARLFKTLVERTDSEGAQLIKKTKISKTNPHIIAAYAQILIQEQNLLMKFPEVGSEYLKAKCSNLETFISQFKATQQIPT